MASKKAICGNNRNSQFPINGIGFGTKRPKIPQIHLIKNIICEFRRIDSDRLNMTYEFVVIRPFDSVESKSRQGLID